MKNQLFLSNLRKVVVIRISDSQLQNPIRCPTNNVHQNDTGNQISNFPVGFLLLPGFARRSDRSQFSEHLRIEEQDQRKRDQKTQNESIDRKHDRWRGIINFIKHGTVGHVCKSVVQMICCYVIVQFGGIPNYHAGSFPVHSFHFLSVFYEWNDQKDATTPSKTGNQFGYDRSTPFWWRYGMTYCYIPVSAHDTNKYRTGKLINTCRNHISFTGYVPKHPMIAQDRYNKKWDSY